MADQSLSTGSQEPYIALAADLTHHLGVGENRTKILNDINLAVPPGELVILTGPSGSGKTTLLTLLGALRSGQTGTLRVLGRSVIGLPDTELIELRRSIGFIFQLHNLLDSLSAIDNVAMAARLHTGRDGDVKARAARILERVGLGKQMHRRPSGLSGGQRQRVAVARALVNAPRLILADEPTAALDAKSGAEVVGLLQEQVSGGRASCLMVTHDNRVLDRADRIVSLVDGRIVSDVAVREQVIICEMLAKIEFFSGLSPAELGQVAERMEKRRFAAGDVLVREGEIGEHFFLVRAGEVKVYVGGTGEQSAVATLEGGRYFGERALITGEPRNATVAGSRYGIVYTLNKIRFSEAIAASPSLSDQLRKLYFSRQ